MIANRETYIWLFCIIILLSLTTKIHLDREELSCDKCMVQYHSSLPNEQKIDKSEMVSLQLMHDEFLEGRCIVTWDKNTGFRILRDLINTSNYSSP